MRLFIAILIFIVVLLHKSDSTCNAGYNTAGITNTEYQIIADRYHKSLSAERAQRYIDSMREWLEANGYSTELMLIADMSLRMNIKRFYVVNPDKKKLLNSFIVAHGDGGGSTISNAVFSNINGSFCTSKGNYRIGETYMGKYGRSYKLHGLDNTNTNAYSRGIVFHAFEGQEEEEYSGISYFSKGCPMVAKSSFDYCDSLLQEQSKPVLMCIYK